MITVLYEDQDLVAVDKPSGIVVIPARDEPHGSSLREQLEAQRREHLWVVHRIDRGTTGVVLFARTAGAHRALNTLFEHRNVAKTYLALTRGVPSRTGTIEIPLHTARKNKMRPALDGEPNALSARSTFSILRQWTTPVGPVCLIEAHPHTGRLHQLRVHLRALSAPLLVDPLYGRNTSVSATDLGLSSPHPGLHRLSLHASQISLSTDTHPRIVINSPLAHDLTAVITALSSP